MDKKELWMRNEAFRDELIDYIDHIGSWHDVGIFCNGHLYSSDKNKNAMERKTSNGTTYYDAGEYDVQKQLEYCNPDGITMTFEGPLYQDINEGSNVGEKLNEIGARYGMYYEQGHAWNLAFYEL